MKRQHQTIFGKPNGNCFSTCIACLLGVPVDAMPNFVGDHPGDDGKWHKAASAWLAERGLALDDFALDAEEVEAARVPRWAHGRELIASGKSPRGDWGHCVLWRDDELLWDPHPSGAGLDGPVTRISCLVVTDFALLAQYIEKRESRAA